MGTGSCNGFQSKNSSVLQSISRSSWSVKINMEASNTAPLMADSLTVLSVQARTSTNICTRIITCTTFLTNSIHSSRQITLCSKSLAWCLGYNLFSKMDTCVLNQAVVIFRLQYYIMYNWYNLCNLTYWGKWIIYNSAWLCIGRISGVLWGSQNNH